MDDARRRGAGWLGAGACLWGPLLWRLAPAWSASVEQAHGWGVPLFALYFAWERAREMPPPRPAAGAGRLAAWAALGLALACLPPALTILEGNAGWPLAQWTGFAAAAVATLAALALAGGGAVSAHFAFPTLFVATALTWPAVVTTRLIAELTNANAHFAANVVSALGHPAVANGNAIEVARGFVGLDEACSGVRALQAAFMAGWFFGEVFRFGWARRAGLAALACGAAIAGNALRTTALTWIAAAESPAASARWHDTAGGLELAGTLGAVALLAWALARKRPTLPARRTKVSLAAGGVGWLVAAGGVVAGAAPAIWYGAHEAADAEAEVRWELAPPPAGWDAYALPARVKEVLHASVVEGRVRGERMGRSEFALLARWDDAGPEALNAELHDPTICLPAAGLAVELRPERCTVDVGGVAVALTVGRFFGEGRWQHVFYCHWDAALGRVREGPVVDLNEIAAWRLERVRRGRRQGDAAYLAFVVPVEDEVAARAWAQEWVPRLLRRK